MKILDIKDENLVKKTNNTVKLTIGKKTETYPVYRVNLDLLYYNELNDRIATWIDNYQADPNNELFDDMDVVKRNKIIEQFIMETDPEKMNKTKKNIELVTQKNPGVVLNDGRIIDGNRRYTCLRKLREEHFDSHDYDYFETAILDLDIKDDRRTIKIIELNLQHATDEKADYDQIDYAVGTYRTVEVDKLMSAADYAINADEHGSKVQERIKIAKLMNEYLEFIKMPGQYSYLREKQAYSLFQEMLRPLNKFNTKEEKDEFKKMYFTNYMAGTFSDVKKYARDMANLIGTKYYNELLDSQKDTIDKVIKDKDDADITDKKSLESFTKKLTKEKQKLTDTTEDAIKDYKINTTKGHSAAVVNKSTENLRGIDTRMFSVLNKKELKELEKEMQALQKTVDRINNELLKAKAEKNIQ